MRIAVIGYGAVGRATASLLLARGDEVRVVQRRQPAALAARTTFLAADVEDHDEMLRACDDVDAVVCCIGLPYRASLWERVWPRAVANLLDGCAASRARFVFADNLYMYGPQTQPLTENLPLTTYGRKPRVRAQITELWREARDAGRVRAVAVRASDFYGPDVPTSVLSTYGVARLVAKQAALVPYSPDHPHDFTYVPDFARALVTLLDAPDDAYGQPGTCPTRRHERCARSSSWGRRAPACVHASACCRASRAASSACSARSSPSSARCSSSGTDRTWSTHRSSPHASGATPRHSKTGWTPRARSTVAPPGDASPREIGRESRHHECRGGTTGAPLPMDILRFPSAVRRDRAIDAWVVRRRCHWMPA